MLVCLFNKARTKLPKDSAPVSDCMCVLILLGPILRENSEPNVLSCRRMLILLEPDLQWTSIANMLEPDLSQTSKAGVLSCRLCLFAYPTRRVSSCRYTRSMHFLWEATC